MKRMFQWMIVLVLILTVFFFWRDRSRRYHHILLENQDPGFSDITEIRIGTYNIKSLNNGDSLADVINELKTMDLDLICFEEVDEKSWRAKGIAMMEEIAKGIGYDYYYFYQTMFLGIGYYGLGVISRYPLMEVASEPLDVSLLREPRILAYAKVDVGNEPLNVYLTHLSFRPFEDKYQQMAVLQARFKNSKRTVLIGDFNIFKDEDFFEIEGMHACNQAEQKYITFRDFGFPDNMFYSDDLVIDQLDVMPSTFSDHNLFYGRLQLRKGENNNG